MSEQGVANVGVVGMAVMGSNLARNLARRDGNRVAIFNRTPARMREVAAAHPEAQFVACETLDDFVASLSRPRTAIILVKAGAPTDAVIDELAERFEPGDIIVDCGNAHYPDTIRREKTLRARGIEFAGVGISGGEEGALNGPSIMPGGSVQAYETLGPLLASIAAVAPDGEPCVTHVGTDGAGHFVKMVHNGIEYADMQLIAEAYDLLRGVAGLTPAECADVFRQWNTGELESYLIEITADVLARTDPATGNAFVDVIVDRAAQKGTGAWTVQAAADLGVPVTGIAEAVFARSLSGQDAQRDEGRGLAGPAGMDVADRAALVEDVRQALYASKIVAYSQGFDLIDEGAIAYDWQIDRAAIARIWRAGCIIRAKFLGRISQAYGAEQDRRLLLAAPYFRGVLADAQGPWRRVVSAAVAAGVPAPGFSAALSYYDGVRAERLPAALIQAQRDYFGAHTYGRIDAKGSFHTDWAGDGREHVVD